MKNNTPNKDGIDRRGFLRNSSFALGAAGLAGLSGACRTDPGQVSPAGHSLISNGDVVLFQGDSITDMHRSREKAAEANDQEALGTGYPALAAVELLADRPEAGLKIYNRGISGNKVYQLAERWQADCLDLKPNLLSILIGVNDFWHTLDGSYHGTLEVYERDYRALLERTRKELPRTKLVICEPFALRVGVVNEKWFPEFDRYRGTAKRMAEAFNAVFIPFQAMFDQAVKYAPPGHWAQDGVHPTTAGASLMAHTWLKAVGP